VGDVVALVPYLLGFVPSDSIVAVLLRDARVVLTARLDLPAPGTAGEAPEVLRELTGLRRRTGADHQILLGYGTAGEGRLLLTAMAGRVGRETFDVLWVEPDRWWSLTCTTGCCPTEGTPYELTSHPLAAEAVLAGLAAAPDRSAVAAMVRGPESTSTPDELAELTRRTAEYAEDVAGWPLGLRKRRIAELVRAGLDGPPPGEDDCLLLAVLAADVRVRDVAWAAMSRERAEDHLALWRRVVAGAPPALASAPLGLLGMAAWINGNGALLNCCIERLELSDPGYSLLDICRMISTRALPPSLWEELSAAMRADPALLAG
jgi:hypothetical protein